MVHDLPLRNCVLESTKDIGEPYNMESLMCLIWGGEFSQKAIVSKKDSKQCF